MLIFVMNQLLKVAVRSISHSDKFSIVTDAISADWGMYITRSIGLLYPESCLASHINMVRASPPEFSTHPLLALQHAVTPYTEEEIQGRARSDWFANEGSGYRTIQSKWSARTSRVVPCSHADRIFRQALSPRLSVMRLPTAL